MVTKGVSVHDVFGISSLTCTKAGGTRGSAPTCVLTPSWPQQVEECPLRIAPLSIAALATIFQSTKPVPQSQDSLFHIFNPDTLAKPTAGYSHVAEVRDG